MPDGPLRPNDRLGERKLGLAGLSARARPSGNGCSAVEIGFAVPQLPGLITTPTPRKTGSGFQAASVAAAEHQRRESGCCREPVALHVCAPTPRETRFLFDSAGTVRVHALGQAGEPEVATQLSKGLLWCVLGKAYHAGRQGYDGAMLLSADCERVNATLDSRKEGT